MLNSPRYSDVDGDPVDIHIASLKTYLEENADAEKATYFIMQAVRDAAEQYRENQSETVTAGPGQKISDDDMQGIVSALEKIVKVKDYALRIHLIGDVDDGDVANTLKGFSMPDVDAYLRTRIPASIQELTELVDGYILLIPKDVRKCLDVLPLEDVAGAKFYNELDLYEARAFLPLFNSLFADVSKQVHYDVVPYDDLNDELSVPVGDRDDAEALAGMLAPCTYGRVADGVAKELGCY